MRMDRIIFENYKDAAYKLAEVLPKEKLIQEKWLLVCISLDGIVLADTLASILGLYYEILLTESVSAPNNKECQIAMVSETEEIIIEKNLIEAFDINLDYVYGEAHRKYEEKILKNVYQYRKGDLIGSLKNKKVLLIDGGCESGMTAQVAIKTAINSGASSIAYAAPMIPTDVADSLNSITDEIFTIYRILNYVNVEFYYKEKEVLKPEEIKALLEESPYYMPLQKNTGEQKVCSIQSK